MKELESLRSLLRDKNSIDMRVLAGAFENRSKIIKNFKLSSILFSSIRSPIDLFNEWHSEDFSFNVDEYKEFYQINLSRFIKRGERSIEGSFIVYQLNKTNIWLAFTSDPSDFFENGVLRFIELYRPNISRIYLSSGELNELFEKLEDNLSSQIYVKKAVLYSHISEGKIDYKKEKPVQDLFVEAESNNYYVHIIEYHIQEDDIMDYHGSVSRDSIIYYYSGRINYFFEHLLPIMVNIGIIKLNILKDKERNLEDAEAKPLYIKFSRNVFSDNYDNIRLIKALEKVSGGAIAVYHKNPYLHASFLDFVDGSNFDIFVTSPNKITLIPNYKCSMYSLMRATDQIFKGFEEGKIELAERYTYSFADFIAE